MDDDEQHHVGDISEHSPGFLDVQGIGVLSVEAFQLHSFATVESVQRGTPGFVPDEYLNAIAAETTVTVAELETAGLWERREGGYFLIESNALKMILDFNERSARAAEECQDRGSHIADTEGDEWVICTHCGAPLKRDDGKPVAGPDGSPPNYDRPPKHDFGID